MRGKWLGALVVLWGCATGAASRAGAPVESAAGYAEADIADMAYEEAAPTAAPMASSGAGRPVARSKSVASGSSALMAQALASADGTVQEKTATDAVEAATRVIIYTASLTVAVFEVNQSIARVREVAAAHGGHVSRENNQEIQVRIPAAHFQQALKELEGVGDVLSRQIQAQDVSEEFHDLAVRIRTAEKLLTRLVHLLERAENVEHALRVEQEIRRLTQEIEGMKGRLKFLANRASLSTITMRFQPLQKEDIEQSDLFALPFPWLDALGLDTLLNLR